MEAQISENGDVHLTTEGLASGFNETVSLNENGYAISMSLSKFCLKLI